MEYVIHPAASIFPMIDSQSFESLKASIDEFGQKEPIVFWKGQMIDGRNRLRACQELGVEPSVCELDEEGDPLEHILALNLHRRHLQTSQRAMCAAKLAGLPLGANQHTKGEGASNDTALTSEQAADLFHVGRASVCRALEVLRSGSALVIEQCEAGELAVSLAEELVRAVPEKRAQTAAAQGGVTAIKEAIAKSRNNSTPVEPSSDVTDGESKPVAVDSAEANGARSVLQDSNEPDDKPEDEPDPAPEPEEEPADEPGRLVQQIKQRLRTLHTDHPDSWAISWFAIHDYADLLDED